LLGAWEVDKEPVPYIEFADDAGGTILIEVDVAEVAPPPGVEKAGLRDFLRGKASVVATAEATFADAVESGVDRVARAVEAAVSRLARAPTEVEVTFGLKATGEVGNIAIAKAGAEANIEVRLKWMRSSAAVEDSS
jgi:Trypsin-co-occurring domain 1